MTVAPISLVEKSTQDSSTSKINYQTGKRYYNNANIKDGIDPLYFHSSQNVTSLGYQDTNLPFRTLRSNRVSVIQDVSAPSCTDVSMSDSCDINLICKLNHINEIPLGQIDSALGHLLDGAIFDLSVPQDNFAAFSNKLVSAQSNFNKLPASLRAEFDNDISIFANYLSSTDDKEFQKLLNKHGLIKSVETPAVGVSMSKPVEQIKPTPVNPDIPVSDKTIKQ